MVNNDEPPRVEDLLARLEQAEARNIQYGQHIMKLQDSFAAFSLQPKPKEPDLKLGELPEFNGTKDPEVYLDWSRRMDRIFDHKNLDDDQRFKLAILKLSDYASTWYENLQSQRVRDQKEKITTWKSLKSKMHKRFVPKSYKQKLFVKLNSLKQNSLSVEQYVTEFEKLYLACGCHEDEDQKCAKFLLGLARHIRFACELSSYETFDDLCLLAATVERQFTESKESMVATSSSTKIWDSSNTSHDKRTPPLKAGPNTTQNRVCFRCKGYGHMQADCPSKVLISLSDHLALLSHLHEEEQTRTCSSPLAHIFKEKGEDVKDFTSAHQAIPMLSPESDDGDVLVLRSLLHVAPNLEKDKEQRNNLFRSRCSINGKTCSLIIDGGATTNVASKKMVDTLKLQQRDHPHPYKLGWVNSDGAILVTKQALVRFEIGTFKDQVWCDIVPMDACSLLLGRPWQWDRDSIHFGKSNVYTIAHGDGRVGLQPLPPQRVATKEETTTETQDKIKEVEVVGTIATNSDYLQQYESKKMYKRGKKQEKNDHLLALHHKVPFSVGDYVWLSMDAQQAYNGSNRNTTTMEEGPFKIVHHVNFDTYQVLLGQGICVSFKATDLIPCFEPP